MSNTNTAPAKKNDNKAPKADKPAQVVKAPKGKVDAKYDATLKSFLQGYAVKGKEGALSPAQVASYSAIFAEQWEEVAALVKAGALKTGLGADAWGSNDTSRCRFMHEYFFLQSFDYETSKFLPVFIATSASRIHAFTVCAQVQTGAQVPESITTPSATGAHLNSLKAKYFGVADDDATGSAKQRVAGSAERAAGLVSILATGEGYKMSDVFAKQYVVAKVAREELRTKGAIALAEKCKKELKALFEGKK